MDGKQLLVRDTAQALEAHNRNADRTHGWSAARQQGSMVAVQVNVPMPTQAERDEMRSLDAKLDVFAKLLRLQDKSRTNSPTLPLWGQGGIVPNQSRS